MGADELVRYLKEKLKIEVGETTADGLFTLVTVECLGSCGTAPVMQINDTYYENLTREKRSDSGKAEAAGMSFEPILLKPIPDDDQIDVYEKHGGYSALAKALKEYSPEQITQIVIDSGLRGRGGAGFPTGRKWTFIPKDNTKPVYLCVNADESEPGTFKDRQLMREHPHLLIEGTIIAAYAINCHQAFIYIRGEFAAEARLLEKAIAEASTKGYLGKNILGSGFDLNISFIAAAALISAVKKRPL
jgi:NADH-quinone oxidoreductase subunit F